MFEKFDDEGRKIVIRAHDRARQKGYGFVGPPDLMLALIDDWEPAHLLIDRARLSLDALRGAIETRSQFEQNRVQSGGKRDGNSPVLTQELRQVFEKAAGLVKGGGRTSPAHIFLVLMEDLGAAIREAGLDPKALIESIRVYLADPPPRVEQDSCPVCGAPTNEFGRVRPLEIEVQGDASIPLYVYFCLRCGSAYGLVKGERKDE